MPPRDNPSQRQPSTSLRHANSAKKLIDRYESLNHGNPRKPPEPPNASKRPTKRASRIFSGISLKDKAPIRESFRNLWSAFKKAKPNAKDKGDRLSVPNDDEQDNQERFPTPSSPQEGSSQPLTRSGSLMYLSYTSGPQALWINCQATLASDHLLLSIDYEQGSPFEQRIYLSECSDVRSLALKQLDPNIRGLLPYEGHVDDIKPFELSFDGRRGEKFIAHSVQGRAQWVGVIWDTILRLQEDEKQLLQRTSSIISATDYVTHLKPTERKALDHPLPPVPPRKDELPHLPLEATLSVSEYPISRVSSNTSVSGPPTPCPKSPGVKPSSVLHVEHSLVPSEASYTPPGSSSRAQPIRRQRSLSADSILDAYGDALGALEASQDNTLKPPARERFQLYDPPLPPMPTRLSNFSVHNEREQVEGSLLPLVDEFCEVSPLNINKQAHSDERSSLSADVDVHQGMEGIAQSTNRIKSSVSAIQEHLGANIPTILEKLDDIMTTLLGQAGKNQDTLTSMNNVKPLANTGDVGEKLDHLLAIVSQTTAPKEGCQQDFGDITEEVKSIKALVQSNDEKLGAQGVQAADSARYLNDLNNWLEVFVNRGISQIQTVTTHVQYLSHALGVNTEEQEPRSVVMNELRQLLVQSGTGPGSTQATVDALVEHLNAHSHSSVARVQETMTGLVEQQRQNQEVLLKTLTAELSSEIRGERLRFVEAMKEATQINVQAHVEQFKKELTREVRELTQEVGRLHQERQSVESQIADLFAFYQKQIKPPNAAQINMVPGQLMLNPHPPLQAVHNLPIRPHTGFG